MARGLLFPAFVKTPRALVAAGLGGVVGTVLDLGLLVLLVGHHAPIPAATFIATMGGAATNFVMNKYFAFRDHAPVDPRQVTRFGFVAAVAALLTATAMKLVTMTLAVPLVVAKVAFAAIVFVLWTYPAQRWLVFPLPIHRTRRLSCRITPTPTSA